MKKKTLSSTLKKKRAKLKAQAKVSALEIDAQTLCPFFVGAHTLSINCQSLIKNASNFTKFKTNMDMQNYSQKFCQNMENYPKCPQNKLLTSYYNVLFAKKEAKRLEEVLKNIKTNKNISQSCK